MTKDWDAVQDEIRELSFAQKKPLEEVKELMEQKYKFHASTRAYRMKLKEWGFMRHRPRKPKGASREAQDVHRANSDDESGRDRESSATVEPMSLDTDETMMHNPAIRQHSVGQYGLISNAETTEPTFMGLLSRSQVLHPCVDPWSQARTRASGIVMDMLAAILDNDVNKLEALIVKNMNHVNDPIGMPFEDPSSRFYDHPALNQMVIMQHPDQKLFDIACGMPCGPVIWVMLSHGAVGSKHPLGQDLALHNAIKNNRPYTVQALLVPGRSKVNGEPETTWKPLLQAIYWNTPDIVRFLVDRGADVNIVGSSPHHSGNQTALQLCLEHRMTYYNNKLIPQIREKCVETLKILLEAGADIHTQLTGATTMSPVAMFMKPWDNQPYWAHTMTFDEMECLKIFVSRGAALNFTFNCPCASTRGTFEHQVLWHSTPRMARLVIDNFEQHPNYDGSTLLHEILGFCPDTKRHPTYTLRDIEVLVRKGVSPDALDAEGLTPIMRCLEQCPAVDLVDRLQMLLDCGADVEALDADGDLPYVHAARTLDEPLLSKVMQILVSKVRGRYVNVIDDVRHTWHGAQFPISEKQTYEEVMSCTRRTGDFRQSIQRMIPQDVHLAFQNAYFSIVSQKYLDTITTVAKSRLLSAKEKQEIVHIISMRKELGLAEYRFSQDLVVALLDPQPRSTMLLQNIDVSIDREAGISTLRPDITSMSSASPDTIIANTPPSPPCVPWQFNPNNTVSVENSSSTLKAAETPDTFSDLAFTDIGTTTIRWKDPCAAPRPGDLKKAVAAVLIYECGVCTNGVLLTKAELERHEVEHAHTAKCEDVTCNRRFCLTQRKEVGRLCQDHLFGDDSMTD